MMHACDCVETDETVLFHGVDDGAESADKHLTHLSQAVDCCFMERSKHNKHVVCKNTMMMMMLLTKMLTMVMMIVLKM
eukprot:3809922-Ditylum_brightwellii.AAC.1